MVDEKSEYNSIIIQDFPNQHINGGTLTVKVYIIS